MLVYGTQLVLLPLLGAAGLGGGGTLPPIPPLVSTAAGTAESTPACSRVDLSPLALNHVRDLAFVEGYAEPVLAVLCEPLQTWSGRLAFLSDTCTLSALQLSCRRPSCTPLWDVKGLPHDTTSILPLPNPAGGVLALSDNALLWLSPSHRCGLALNRDASVSCVPQLTPCSPSTRITLKGATAALLSTKPLVVALSLSDGHLYLVRLSTDGRGVHGIELLKVVLSVPACSMCSVASKYLFLGSMVADSLLLQLHDPLAARRLAAGAPSVERLASGLFAAKAPDAKRQKVVVKIENGAAEPMEEEEAAADVLDGAIVPTTRRTRRRRRRRRRHSMVGNRSSRGLAGGFKCAFAIRSSRSLPSSTLACCPTPCLMPRAKRSLAAMDGSAASTRLFAAGAVRVAASRA